LLDVMGLPSRREEHPQARPEEILLLYLQPGYTAVRFLLLRWSEALFAGKRRTFTPPPEWHGMRPFFFSVRMARNISGRSL